MAVTLILLSGMSFASSEKPKELKLVKKLNFDSSITSVAFYPDGKPKVVCTEKEILMYDSNEKVVRRQMINIKGDARDIATVSENGEYIGIVSTQGMGTEKYLYQDRKWHILFKSDVAAQSQEISPNGQYLVFESYANLSALGYIKFIDRSGKLINSYDPKIKRQANQIMVRFSKDGEYCLVAIEYPSDGGKMKTIVCLFKNSGRELKFSHQLELQLKDISISSNGKYFIVGGYINGQNMGNNITPAIYIFSRSGLVWEKMNEGPIVGISKNGENIVTSRLAYYSEKTFQEYFTCYSIKGDKLFAFSPELLKGYNKNNAFTGALKYSGPGNKNYIVYSVTVPGAEYLIAYDTAAKEIMKRKYDLPNGEEYGKTGKPNELGYWESGGILNKNIICNNDILVILGAKVIQEFKLD